MLGTNNSDTFSLVKRFLTKSEGYADFDCWCTFIPFTPYELPCQHLPLELSRRQI